MVNKKVAAAKRIKTNFYRLPPVLSRQLAGDCGLACIFQKISPSLNKTFHKNGSKT